MERVVVTGLGLVTALGADKDVVFRRLLDQDCAITDCEDLRAAGFRHVRAGRCPESPSQAARGRQLAVAAARAAAADSGLKLPEDTFLCVGSTMGESSAFEVAAQDDLPRSVLIDATSVSFARAVRAELGLRGDFRTYGTACAAGNYAIGSAAAHLSLGRGKVALAGGVEPFSRIAMLGFSRSRAMSSHGVCRPFDLARDGMVLGEGAAFLVLEVESHARARGATPWAVVGALGLSCDAEHPVAPLPDGSMAGLAFQDALSAQGLTADQIDWVCAHGTGTVLSDAAEAQMLHRVFGAKSPPVSSLKGALGHTLGAASAIEACVCVMALQHQVIPPNVGLQQPAFDLDLVDRPRPASLGWVANVALAFGGLNTVLLMGRYA
ncbi:MAG TPA: beta-ketoacyl-[acyl-carrier-protein] synthase family protein [Polyangiaceae bacterium]|nr:beta-ketoacyl-[acyl-carrier-protein] synthase family protein [Polyangiaceae bacterium]